MVLAGLPTEAGVPSPSFPFKFGFCHKSKVKNQYFGCRMYVISRIHEEIDLASESLMRPDIESSGHSSFAIFVSTASIKRSDVGNMIKQGYKIATNQHEKTDMTYMGRYGLHG